MARSGDNAPVGQTCRQIDDVISSLGELYVSSEPISKGELNDLEKTMEGIRRDNEQLRNWGNEQYERAEEMEKDRDYYQNEFEKANDEIKYLKSEIKELEKELSQQ